MILLNILLNGINIWVDNLLEIKVQSLMFLLQSNLNKKSIELDFELLASPKILEKKELAIKGLSDGNFIEMIRSFRSMFSSIITLIGIIYLVLKIDVLIMVVAIIIIGINTIFASYSKRVEYKLYKERVPFLRKIGYVDKICLDFIRKTSNSMRLGKYITLFTNSIQEITVYSINNEAINSIEFYNVSFKYSGQDNYAIKNLYVKINGNERIAIVGENGSGKTTFIKLLTRLYDLTEGEIRLDEPTAALDPRAEYEIYQKFNDLIENKTDVFISHRLSSTHFCDRVLLFKKGILLESGTHESLMESGGEYKEMYEMQSQYYLE